MGCPEPMEALVSAYLDGEVGTEERRLVEEHLETCPSCAALRDRLERDRERFVTLLHRAAAQSPAPAAVRPPSRKPLHRRSIWVPTPRRYRVAYLLAGIAAGLALGLALGWDSVASRPPVGRIAAAEGTVLYDPLGRGHARAVAEGDEIRGAGVVRAAELLLESPRATKLETGPEGGVTIALDRGGSLTLAAETTALFPHGASVALLRGALEIHKEPGDASPLTLRSPRARVRLLSGRLEVAAEEDATRLTLRAGELDLRSAGAETRLVALEGKPRSVRVGADGEVVFVAPGTAAE